MLRKFIPLSLCLLCIVSNNYGFKISGYTLDFLFDCYNFANCESDGPAHKKLQNCISNLTKKDLNEALDYINNNGFFKYKSNDEDKALKEYCHYEEGKQKNAFDRTVGGVFSFKMEVCSSPSKQDQCQRFTKAVRCFFPTLRRFHKQGQC